MPIGKTPAERLALKLHNRSVKVLGDVLGATLVGRRSLKYGEPRVIISHIESSFLHPGSYSFDIDERALDNKWLNMDGTYRDAVFWSATVEITPERDVIIKKKIGEPPMELITEVVSSSAD